MISSWLDFKCQKLLLARGVSSHYHIFLRLPSQELSIFIINVSGEALREVTSLHIYSIKICLRELSIAFRQAVDVLYRTLIVRMGTTIEALRNPNFDVTWGLNLGVEARAHIILADPVAVPEAATRLAGKARN